MAESADVLCAPHQQVILPDLAAGCSMADMAEIDQLETCWRDLEAMGVTSVIPVTYINSSAAIKAFVGEHGGIVCTSGNASAVLKWAWEQRRADPVPARPAPGPQHRLQDGRAARSDGRLGSATSSTAGSRRRGSRREAAAVEGPLLGPRAFHRAADRAGARAASRRARDRASGSAVGRRAGGRRQRLDRTHSEAGPRERCRQHLGRGHRGAPREPARARGRAGQDRASRSTSSGACARRCSACRRTTCCGSSRS